MESQEFHRAHRRTCRTMHRQELMGIPRGEGQENGNMTTKGEKYYLQRKSAEKREGTRQREKEKGGGGEFTSLGCLEGTFQGVADGSPPTERRTNLYYGRIKFYNHNGRSSWLKTYGRTRNLRITQHPTTHRKRGGGGRPG